MLVGGGVLDKRGGERKNNLKGWPATTQTHASFLFLRLVFVVVHWRRSRVSITRARASTCVYHTTTFLYVDLVLVSCMYVYMYNTKKKLCDTIDVSDRG